jgi:sulfatase maturation enzyme AslB (radical SAM superfamily)
MTEHPADQLPLCHEPWYELNTMYNGRMACCCYYNGPASVLDLDRWPDLFSYWNGDFMRKVRAEVVGTIPENSGCRGCVMYKYRTLEEFRQQFKSPYSWDGYSSAQRENRERAMENFTQGKLVVDHVPLRFYFNFGVTCNIACIMCCQTPERPSHKTLNADRLLAWKPHMMKSEMISVIGGEPLVLPEAIKFIRAIARDDDYETVRLEIFSNGLNLDKFLDELTAKKRISLCVSLDGIGASYEHIRAGSSWARVERNMLAFKEMAAKKGLPWRLMTANIVMKSSLATIDELARWHVQHDIPPNFVDFMNFPGVEETYFKENIFAYPDLLAEVPDWGQRLDAAIHIFTKKEWYGTADLLRKMKLDLITRLFSPFPEESSKNSCQAR